MRASISREISVNQFHLVRRRECWRACGVVVRITVGREQIVASAAVRPAGLLRLAPGAAAVRALAVVDRVAPRATGPVKVAGAGRARVALPAVGAARLAARSADEARFEDAVDRRVTAAFRICSNSRAWVGFEVHHGRAGTCSKLVTQTEIHAVYRAHVSDHVLAALNENWHPTIADAPAAGRPVVILDGPDAEGLAFREIGDG